MEHELEQSELTCKMLQITSCKKNNNRLTDHEVDLVRQMHEEFPPQSPGHLGYRRLAAMWGVSRYTIRNLCLYRRR